MTVTNLAGPPPSPRRTVPPHPWVVLLVDDEPDVLASTGELLEQSLRGVRVLCARSGREALELLANERVDAVVSDFKMVGMDGIEFLRKARESRPRIPRVVWTAYGDTNLVQRAEREAEVKSFIAKAVTPDELVCKVAALLTYQPETRPSK